MYPSPIRVVSRSISPLSRVNSQKVVNNPGPPPPGMKTMYKPVYFEAVEMPLQQYRSMPREMHQSDIELQNKIQALEEQVSTYRKQLEPETAKLQKVIAEQRKEIQALSNPNEQSITELREQCKMYFTKYQQIEYERNELVHQLRLNEPQLERVKQLQDTIKDLQRELDKIKNENTLLKSKSKSDIVTEVKQDSHRDNSNRDALHETQRRGLEEQINKYRIQIDEVTHQYELYRERHHQMDLDKMNFTQRIAELEMTTLHQQKEIDRLTVASVNKQNESDLLRQRIQQLEFGNSSVISQGLEMDIKRLKEQLESRSREIEDLKNRNRDMESALLKSKEKAVELEILKGRFHTLEGQSIESQRFKVLSTQLEYELRNAQYSQQKYDAVIADHKRNEHRLQSEIQRLSDLLRIKDDDISRLTQDYRDNMSAFQNQIKSYSSQQQTNDRYRQSDNYDENNNKIEQLEEEIKGLKAERLQLQRTIEQLQNTKIQLESHIVQLEDGINKSKRSLQNQAQKSLQDQEKFEQYERQIVELHQQIDIYRKELELMYTRPDSRQPSQKFTIPSHQNSLL